MALTRCVPSLALCGLVLVAPACKTSGGSGGPPAKASSNQLRETALAAIRAKADVQRQEMVRTELGLHVQRQLSYDASGLDDADRRLLAKLLEAADVVEELNLLQANPKMLEYRAQVERGGTEDDRALFLRNHGPWCLEGNDVRCCALRSAPPKAIGMHAWPKDFTAEMVRQLVKHPAHRTLLSPYTLVRATAGKLAAVPMFNDELLGPRIKKLSQLLKDAAALAREPTLKRFLVARAAALLSDSPFPYDDSDLDWIATAGKWEVTVGAYETYRNPLRTKARFAMYVGLQDPEVTERLSRYGKQLQRMENALASLVGRKVYKPRKISAKTAIRAIELIRAAGDARRSRGAVVAYHLPNVGKGPEQGLTKKVILINHLRVTHELTQARAKLVLPPDLAALVTPDAAIANITFHEFCHGFGAYPTMPIKVNDKETTVGDALGEHSLILEELKAEALSLWLVDKLRRRRVITRAEQKSRYVTALVRLVGLLQMDLRGTHPKAAAVLLGTLLKERAAIHDASTGRWRVDLRRFPKALARLTKAVATIQFTGHKIRAAELIDSFVMGKGEAVTLVDTLELIRVGNKAAFAKAGITPVTFVYEVKNASAPAKKPAAKKPAAKKPAAKKPAAKKPAVKKPAVKKPAVKKPAVKKPEAKKAPAKK